MKTDIIFHDVSAQTLAHIKTIEEKSGKKLEVIFAEAMEFFALHRSYPAPKEAGKLDEMDKEFISYLTNQRP